jgi:DNA-3-methyladenine glycosylase
VAIADLREHRVPPAFYQRDVTIVARALVGCALVHKQRAGLIVETEAYLGPDDAASHARFGPTKRTSVMFGPGGRSYVYLCYGVHEMFNIVTGADGQGQAVLIRAIAPLFGFGAAAADQSIGRGPGKVTRALLLDRSHDRRDLATGGLYVATTDHAPPIDVGPRIGVDYAGEWAARPLRFWWRDHPAVSSNKRSRATPSKPPI